MAEFEVKRAKKLARLGYMILVPSGKEEEEWSDGVSLKLVKCPHLKKAIITGVPGSLVNCQQSSVVGPVEVGKPNRPLLGRTVGDVRGPPVLVDLDSDSELVSDRADLES